MKLRFYIFLLIPFLYACEKVIDVDLNDAAPAIVIEGSLTGYPDFAKVKITKTSSYFDASKSPVVTGARVMIESEKGESYLLNEEEDGVYTSENVALQINSSYKLTVEAEGEIYTAESTLPPPVYLDSLGYFYEDSYIFFEDGYVLQTFFTDPANIENYYRFRVFVNGEMYVSTGNFYVFNDRFTDGKRLEVDIRNVKIVATDTVVVQLVSIDKPAYDFYTTFENLMFNNPGSAAPANPITNFSNGALGYFSAWTSSTRSVIIQEEK